MSMYMLNDKARNFYEDYYGVLVGATITKATLSFKFIKVIPLFLGWYCARSY